MNKMCSEFDFAYAMQISSRSVNPLSYFIYIYENDNRNYLEKYIENRKILMNKMCLEFNFTYAVQISSGSVNKYVTSRDAVRSL